VNFCFHPLAEADFDEAVKYYETCQTGLGIEFAQEVYATIDLFHPILMLGLSCLNIRDDAS
jgi:hypothetical protein